MPSYLNQIPPDLASLSDYQAYAQRNLTEQAWAYIHGGSADEVTFQRNLSIYNRLQLNSRVLADVSKGNTELTLLGQRLAHPILVAPVAYQKLAHPDGEVASAMAAAAQDAVFCLSTLASQSLEDVAEHCDGPRWFQLYFQSEREHTLALVRRAEQAGYRALMVTVDAPVNGLRNREQRAGFQLPAEVRAVNVTAPAVPVQIQQGDSRVFQGLMAQAPRWADIQWLRQQTQLPIILKGITNPQDVEKALAQGIDGLVLSNHGGRTLDGLPNPIEVLPDIAEQVQGRVPLIVDSGIRRGGDVVKALALGADAVMIGRPVMYGLATAGALGVAHTLRLLRDELELTMALCGCASLADITPDLVRYPKF